MSYVFQLILLAGVCSLGKFLSTFSFYLIHCELKSRYTVVVRVTIDEQITGFLSISGVAADCPKEGARCSENGVSGSCCKEPPYVAHYPLRLLCEKECCSNR